MANVDETLDDRLSDTLSLSVPPLSLGAEGPQGKGRNKKRQSVAQIVVCRFVDVCRLLFELVFFATRFCGCVSFTIQILTRRPFGYLSSKRDKTAQPRREEN